MELRDVETFLVLAEELHFRRAAERLSVSTARVSQTVRALETEVGARLFARHSRLVRLTPLGKRFRADAEQGYAQLRRALREAQATARGIVGELRVGHFTAVAAEFVAQLAAAFAARYVSSRVLTVALPGQVGFGSLRSGQVDILLAWCPGVDTVLGGGRGVGPVLATDTRAVLVSSRHPLAGFERLSIEDVADHKLLDLNSDAPRRFVEGWLPHRTPSGRAIRRGNEDPASMLGREPVFLEDVFTIVAGGRTAYLTNCSILDHHPYPGLVVVPVDDLPSLVLAPIWHTERETAAVRAFVELAQSTAPGVLPAGQPAGRS